jgi:hypothetical protein
MKIVLIDNFLSKDSELFEEELLTYDNSDETINVIIRFLFLSISFSNDE